MCFPTLCVFPVLYVRLMVYIVTLLSAASFVLVSSGGSHVVWLSILVSWQSRICFQLLHLLQRWCQSKISHSTAACLWPGKRAMLTVIEKQFHLVLQKASHSYPVFSVMDLWPSFLTYHQMTNLALKTPLVYSMDLYSLMLLFWWIGWEGVFMFAES